MQNIIRQRIIQPVINEQTTAQLETQVHEGKAAQAIMNAPVNQGVCAFVWLCCCGVVC